VSHRLGPRRTSKLEDTRDKAETELTIIRGRKAALAELERDRDALLESYAGIVPGALDTLAPVERRQVYGMLRLEVEVAADGSMVARGVLSETLRVLYENGQVLCENRVASACNSKNTKLAELTFHAVVGNGVQDLRFERLLTR
jgi:hypothetical protein